MTNRHLNSRGITAQLNGEFAFPLLAVVLAHLPSAPKARFAAKSLPVLLRTVPPVSSHGIFRDLGRGAL